MYITIAMGSTASRWAFETACSGIWSQVRSFSADPDPLPTANDFYFDLHQGGLKMTWDYYVWPPGFNLNSWNAQVVQLAFQALYKVLGYLPAGPGETEDVPRALPLLAESFRVYQADKFTPVLFGYLRATGWR